MYRPVLLLLSDLTNGDADEDIGIGDFLNRDFRIYVAHPRDTDFLEEEVDAIIIRNIWNPSYYGCPEPWLARWGQKKLLPLHDDLHSWKGSPKEYLLNLFSQGFPVIPTVESSQNLARLPVADTYFIKPVDGFDAIGARVVSSIELRASQLQGHLIQPVVDFVHECSFYYLDGIFQYSLYAPTKAERWTMVEFEPSTHDLTFAERFVSWNKQRRGIVRIDACRLDDGVLLLMEISGQGGVYLSLSCLSDHTRHRFLERLAESLKELVFRDRREAKPLTHLGV